MVTRMPYQVRYDEERGVYRDCKWCGGKGCLACPGEARKEYKRQFPEGPIPILTIPLEKPLDLSNQEDRNTVAGLIDLVMKELNGTSGEDSIQREPRTLNDEPGTL